MPGVVSSTQVVFDRQVQVFQANPNISILNAALTGCIAGDPMLGVELLFNKESTYQRSWYIVRNGRSYDFQWVAAKGQEQIETFAEMIRTWKWLPNVAMATPGPIQSSSPSTTSAASDAPSAEAFGRALGGLGAHSGAERFRVRAGGHGDEQSRRLPRQPIARRS